VSGIGSLPLMPLALEEADADPSLRMPELRASMFRPPDILPCSLDGVNMFCRSIAAPLAAAAPPRAYGTVGGAGVPRLRRVTGSGAPVPPSGRFFAVKVGPVPPAGSYWPLPPGGGFC